MSLEGAGSLETVTLRVFVLEELRTEMARISAVPGPTAVTRPVEDTVATFLLLDAHLTSWDALAGLAVALSWKVERTLSFRLDSLSERLVGRRLSMIFTFALDQLLTVAGRPPTVTVPTFLAVIRPVDEIVAMDVLPLRQRIFWLAFEGYTVPVSWWVDPVARSMVMDLSLKFTTCGLTAPRAPTGSAQRMTAARQRQSAFVRVFIGFASSTVENVTNVCVCDNYITEIPRIASGKLNISK